MISVESLYVLYVSVINRLYCINFCANRWGDNRSPAFGELSDSHFFRPVEGSKEDRLAMWGQVQAYTFTYSIATIFVHSYDLFINGWAKVFNFFSVFFGVALISALIFALISLPFYRRMCTKCSLVTY